MDAYLRKATEADMDLLFAWANDTEVRRNSFSVGQISYEEHKRWFLKLLTDTSRRQYIYMADHVPVGQVRIQIQGEKAEIGYSISAQYRGQGHGRKMLDLLREQLVTEEPDIHILTAKVKTGNPASEKTFKGAGYRSVYTCLELRLGK